MPLHIPEPPPVQKSTFPSKILSLKVEIELLTGAKYGEDVISKETCVQLSGPLESRGIFLIASEKAGSRCRASRHFNQTILSRSESSREISQQKFVLHTGTP